MMLCSCQQELTAGPAVFGESPSTLCISAAKNEKVLAGEVFQAPKANSVTIKDIQITGGKNAHLTASYIVPIGAEGAIGSASYPVDLDQIPSWTDRRKAAGSTVHAGNAVSVALVLQRGEGASDGNVGHASVTYSIDGQDYKREGAITFELASSCS